MGSPVTWSYEVKNTGNVVLTDVNVTDDKLGQIGTIDRLEVGETVTLTEERIAEEGQYSNTGTAIGMTPDESEVSDTDPDYYFGLARHLACQEDQWLRLQYRPRPKHFGGRSGHLEL